MSNRAVINGISNEILVNWYSKLNIDKIFDKITMDEVFTSSDLSLQSDLVTIFTDEYALSKTN